MAAKGSTARTAVTATGVALLALINENGGSMMLTQAEGQDIIANGNATVDTSKVEGDTALVSLTDAGRAVLAAGDPSTTGAGGGKFDIDDGVQMPTENKRRGRTGGYPFERLEIGQSFHVAKTAENPDPAARLQSSVSGARVRFSEEIPGETEEVTVKTYKKDANGDFAKDVEGKRIVETETKETRPKTKLTRDFVAKAVGADDPRGEGARVWRVALSA